MDSTVWALKRLEGMVVNHLRLASKKRVGSRAVRSAADLAREWGANEAAIRQAIADAVESSSHKDSPEADVLKKVFALT